MITAVPAGPLEGAMEIMETSPVSVESPDLEQDDNMRTMTPIKSREILIFIS